MTPWLKSRCERLNTDIEMKDRWRTRKVCDNVSATHLKVEDKTYLQFASNDYLGLANEAINLCNDKYTGQVRGRSSGASPMISGYSSLHQEFERSLAYYLGFEAAVYFNSGFTANESVLSSLVSQRDVVFADRFNHASLFAGVQHSKARQYRYRHLDVAHLRRLLETKEVPVQGRRWIVTDSVFSMDGDLAPLDQLVALAKEFQAAIYVDDAHGFGVYGGGRGTVSEFNVAPSDIDVLMITCGKAMGAMGAAVVADRLLLETVLQRSKAYIYSTAVSPLVLQICIQALDQLKRSHAARTHLFEISHYLAMQLKDIASPYAHNSFSTGGSSSYASGRHPIQPFIIGEERDLIRFNQHLLYSGVLVGAIRPPTVPAGTARLRISLNAKHTKSHVDQLCDAIKSVPIPRRLSENR